MGGNLTDVTGGIGGIEDLALPFGALNSHVALRALRFKTESEPDVQVAALRSMRRRPHSLLGLLQSP